MKPWLNARKIKTQWLWGDWEGLEQQQLKQKLLERMADSEDAQEKFWSYAKILGTDCCWEWQGALDSYGYGTFNFQYEPKRRKGILSHRISYFLTHGNLPDHLLVCHHCDNTKCVNPQHLFLGTHNDNRHDSIKKNRHCRGEGQHAHKLTEKQVIQVRQFYQEGMTYAAIGEKFGMTKTGIWAVVSGKTWKHVPFPKGFEPYE
jgi:hypothetical protein